MSPTSISLSELARILELEYLGQGETLLTGACSLEWPRASCLSFVEKVAQLRLEPGAVGALVASQSPGEGWNVLLAENPRLTFARALELLYPPELPVAGVHPSARVAEGALVDPQASIGPLCVVGPGVRLEAGVHLVARVSLGPNCSIGRNSRLEPGVSLGEACQVGENCWLEPLAQLADNTVVERDVYIGARCRLEGCHVGRGSKLDNLVFVGRNTRLGRGVLLISQSLVEADCRLGDYSLVAAQAVVARGVEIGPQVQVAGRCWVDRSFPERGQALAGEPAVDYAQEMKARALRARALASYRARGI